MRRGIVRAPLWPLEPRQAVWFFRVPRWINVVSMFHGLISHEPPIWAGVAGMALCLYGELRDWSSRKRGYSLSLRTELLTSIMASTMAANSILIYGAQPAVLRDVGGLMLGFVDAAFFAYALMCEAKFQRGLAEVARTAPSILAPPFGAELLLYFALPRREREPIVGDLNEDFATTVLPKFGPLCAFSWYWYKAILYVWMYACEHAIEPLIRCVIEPSWRRVVLPLLKWIVAPAVLAHQLGWAHAIRAFLDKLIK